MSDPGNIKNICLKNNLAVTDDQLDMLSSYVKLFREWNEKINLLSRKDIENIWIRHIIGSLALLFENSLAEKCTIADVGTGGGLPGLPLAIMLPDSRVTLIDSITKKIGAVDDMISALSLGNVKALHGRAEDLSRKSEYRYSFDYVIARAVATVEDVVNWSSGFLKNKNKSPAVLKRTEGKPLIPPGSIILVKGGDVTGEISRLITHDRNWKAEIHPMTVAGIPPEDLQDKKYVIVSERKNG